MAKRCPFGTGYNITYSNNGIKVRLSLGKACTNLCHVFGFVISTPGQGQQLLAGLFKKMVRRSTSSKGVNSFYVLSGVEPRFFLPLYFLSLERSKELKNDVS